MEHFLIKNNSVSKYNTNEQRVCPCQRMRTKGYNIINLTRHLELLDFTYNILYGESCTLQQSEVESACNTLLLKGGYSSSATHIVEMQYDQDKNLLLRVVETSPYKEFALRALRPNAQLFSIEGHELTLQTTAATQFTELLRLLSRHYNCDVPLCVNSQGEVWSVDGTVPFVVKGKQITIGTSMDTVEAEMAATALASLIKYEVKMDIITVDQALDADEIFYVDSRGITCLKSISGNMLSDNIANLLYRTLNFVV